MEVPFTKPGVWPDGIPPSRMAAHIHKVLPVACRVAIIGLADDLGVKLNSGRPGAAGGPNAFRAALARYGAAHPAGWSWPVVLDAGDVIAAHGHDEAALHETHNRVTTAVAALLKAGLFPVGIGGGHDLTFPFVRAVAQASPAPLAGVYFDAHLDVRETPGSGMPFRSLVESCGVRSLDLIGFSHLSNNAEHKAWFEAHGGTARAPDFKDWPRSDLFVSLDLDCLDMSVAPGVSAPNPSGLPPAQVERAVCDLGANPRVRCFDIMELNPEFDDGGRTARLAAHLFLQFLRGFAQRPA